MKPLIGYKKNISYHNHYFSAYPALVYYINTFILVIFVYKFIALAPAVSRVGERFADFVRKTLFRANLSEIKNLRKI